MKKVQRINKASTKNRQRRMAKEEINRKQRVDKEKTKQTLKEQGIDEDEARKRHNNKKRRKEKEQAWGRHKGRDIVTEKINKKEPTEQKGRGTLGTSTSVKMECRRQGYVTSGKGICREICFREWGFML